ncbi:hypothetical protein [Ralstonia syzygii]|uniref:hypothetical protein n=1 Tax=Ralstonia syzygii TaxID=28097 RepID=UPI003519A865
MPSDSKFIESVLYFYFEKGDVTRYTAWDEDRCKALMPAFYHALKAYEVTKDILARVARSYGESEHE